MNILREEPILVTVLQGSLNISIASSRRPSFHKTWISQNRHTRKADFGQPKIVFRLITHNVLATQKFTFDCIDCANETWIVASIKPRSGSRKHAGVEFVDAESGGEGAALFVPGSFEQAVIECSALRRPSARRDP